MTREAKIGLLTGLGVIVLIGVLLSEYLGGPGGPGGATGSGATSATATNRMAPLPIAQAYRDQQMRPIGVPGMARSEPAEVAPPVVEPVVAVAPMPATPVTPAAPLMNQIAALPRALATDTPAPADVDASALPTGPVVGQAVTPINDGPVLAHVPANNSLPTGVPMFQIQDTQPVSLTTGNSTTGSPTAAKPAAAVNSQEYVIASGDTLMKIAKKFYNSSKPDDCQKIVAANPALLKSTTTMLVVGKRLTIPNVPQQVAVALRPSDGATPAAPSLGTSSPVAVKPGTAVLIRTPGAKAEAEVKAMEVRKVAVKAEVKESHYTVSAGDTPEKIARKLGGNSDYAKQLMAVNKIKDPSKLQVGMRLKLPAK